MIFSLTRNLKATAVGWIACFLLCLSSCNSDEVATHGRGFRVSLSDEVSVTSRSTPAELGKPIADNFHLLITRQDKDLTLYDGAYTNNLIEAPVGSYRLKASFGTDALLGVDSPYYEGTVDTELSADEEHTVTIPCSVANALISAKYTNPDKFQGMYSDYGIKVEVNDQYVRLSGTEAKSAYFRAGSQVKVSFYATLKDDGREVSTTLESADFPTTIQAADHIILSLTAQAVTSGTILTVDKVEVKKETVTETVPLEWLPKPKVSGFEGGATSLTYTETEDISSAAIHYTASQPMQDVEFTLDFQDAQYTSLNKTYTLSTLSDEDRTALTDAGIVVPVLDSTSTEGKLDLTALAATLQTNAGAEVVNHVTLRVKANNRWSSESGQEYTIRTIRPEFTVSVRDVNCWSKEFTAEEISVTSGNAEKIKENLAYQYSSDGGSTWQTCSNNRQQVFSSIPSNKSYKVRACYRNCIYSNTADATLETPTQLPNSDMESWYIEKKTKSGTWPFKDKTYYTFHPYANGTASSSWWDTNNDLAQGGTYALGIWYEGCFASCVSYTEDAHGGSKAALMYLSGCGSGYANTSGTYVGGAMVGSLFIGSYNSGIVQGHTFASRPTSLSFWYKYKPYNSDAFKVVVSLKNGNEEIATGTYEPAASSQEDNSYGQAVVNFTYSTTEKKATTICVQFLASNKTSLSESDFEKGTTINYPTIGNWTVHMGSVLKIDDLSLNYTK